MNFQDSLWLAMGVVTGGLLLMHLLDAKGASRWRRVGFYLVAIVLLMCGLTMVVPFWVGY